LAHKQFRLWLVDRAGSVLAERRSHEGMIAAGKLGFTTVLQSHLEAVGAAHGLPVVVRAVRRRVVRSDLERMRDQTNGCCPIPPMKRPLIAILRGVRPDEVADIVSVLIESGMTAIGNPLSSPDPFRSIEIAAKDPCRDPGWCGHCLGSCRAAP
jgi:hypothetical protein